MMQALIEQLLFINFNGQCPLIHFAETACKIIIEPVIQSHQARFELFTGFAKRGEKFNAKAHTSELAKNAFVYGYMLGGHAEMALKLIKRDASLHVIKIKALALMGDKKKVSLALRNPNDNQSYASFMEAAIHGYALGNHHEALLELLPGTRFIADATEQAAFACHNTLVSTLIDSQHKPSAIELLQLAALKGYARGNHIDEASATIKQGASIAVWATTVNDFQHCDNKLNAMLLLACFDEEERQDHDQSLRNLLSISFNEDELALIEKTHQLRQTSNNIYQAFYEATTSQKSELLSELNLESVISFTREQIDSLTPGATP